MKFYIKEIKRSRNNVELFVVLGDIHPLLDHVYVTRVLWKDGVPTFMWASTPSNNAMERVIYHGIITSNEATLIVEALQKTYFDMLSRMGYTDSLSETPKLKETKKER